MFGCLGMLKKQVAYRGAEPPRVSFFTAEPLRRKLQGGNRETDGHSANCGCALAHGGSDLDAVANPQESERESGSSRNPPLAS